MFLKSLRIDRFGGRHHWHLDGLTDTIQVLQGGEGSGKRTILRFLRAACFGFERKWAREPEGDGGTVILQASDGKHVLRRCDDGTVDGRLTLEDHRGRIGGQHELDTILNGISAESFDHLFAIDFAARPEVAAMIEHAEAVGVELGGGPPSGQVAALQDQLRRQRQALDALPSEHRSLESLAHCRSELADQISDLERHTPRHRSAAELARLVAARDRVEAGLADARKQVAQLEREHQALLARRDQIPGIGSDASSDENAVVEIDQRVHHWRSLINEIAASKQKVQDDLARYDGAAARAANPRKPLKQLESRISQFESRLANLETGECVCRPLQAELKQTVAEVRKDIHTLCEEIGRWELAREYQSFAHQRQHLDRCESELETMVQTLLDSRAELGDSRIDRWCQCDAHPFHSDASQRDHYRRQLLSEVEQQLDENNRARTSLQARISELECELADLLRCMANDLDDTSGTIKTKLEQLRTELDSVQAALRNVERRRVLRDEIDDLQTKLDHLRQDHSKRDLMAAAGDLLRAFSGGKLQQIELDVHRNVWVLDRVSRRLAWHELSAGGRDQAYLALRLAIQPQLERCGVRLPLLVKDAFSNFDAEHVRFAAKALRETVDCQVIVLTRHQHVAEVFRREQVEVRSLEESNSRDHQTWEKRTAAPSQLTPESPIEDAPSIHAQLARRMRASGIDTVRQLLRIAPDDAALQLGLAGVTGEEIRNWQAQAHLMCSVRHLTAYDARILVACDVTDPAELDAIAPSRLREMIQQFAASPRGRALLMSGTERELSRVAEWMSAHDADDPFSRRLARGAERRSRHRQHAAESADNEETASARAEANRGGSRHNSRNGSNGHANEAVLRMEPEEQWQFYLDLSDPIVDAPSIGPRTAERLEAIGIETVADFLAADSGKVSEQLGQKRITNKLIKKWQAQTVLATRIPQLRGHDAQILVAVGIIDPAELAETSAEELWSKVQPFIKTNQGKRIIRNGKSPDFEEVADWIRYAKAARQLKAA